MTKFVIEILKEVNQTPDTLKNYLNNNALQKTFIHAFDTRFKFILPEGVPPYKPDAAALGMSPGNYSMETRKFYVFQREDLKSTRREALFIQLLEGVHPSEAELLIAMKEQDLGSVFPNITFDLVKAAGFLPETTEEFAAVPPVKSEDKPRGKGRPPGSKNLVKSNDTLETLKVV